MEAAVKQANSAIANRRELHAALAPTGAWLFCWDDSRGCCPCRHSWHDREHRPRTGDQSWRIRAGTHVQHTVRTSGSGGPNVTHSRWTRPHPSKFQTPSYWVPCATPPLSPSKAETSAPGLHNVSYECDRLCFHGDGRPDRISHIHMSDVMKCCWPPCWRLVSKPERYPGPSQVGLVWARHREANTVDLGRRRCSKVSMSVIPVLGGGVGVRFGTPDSKHSNNPSNSVGIGLGGDVGTGVAGSKNLSKASRLSSPTGGVVTAAATIWSANTPPVRPRCILVKPSPVSGHLSAWLSNTRQQSTISRMGVSGGTLSRCRRKAHLSCPATNRSGMMRSRTVEPMSTKALTASVSSAMAKIDGSSPSIWAVLSNWRR